MTFKLNLSDDTRLDELADSILDEQETVMRELLPKYISEIQAKTEAGQDSDGSAFPNYSPSYAEFKRRALGQSGRPNLRRTGDMMRSLVAEVRRLGSVVKGFINITGADNQDKARWNQGENDNIPARRFMALSDEQVVEVQDKLTETFE